MFARVVVRTLEMAFGAALDVAAQFSGSAVDDALCRPVFPQAQPVMGRILGEVLAEELLDSTIHVLFLWV